MMPRKLRIFETSLIAIGMAISAPAWSVSLATVDAGHAFPAGAASNTGLVADS